ncbi:MAG: class I SAM-dependent methyltransferase [Candidatus Neomarinimicrobiota bacterium]
MTTKTKVDSREAGLEIGLLLGKYFFETEDLHYGYWPPDLEVKIANFSRAQDLHSEFIIANIPAGVKSILDVGAGAGNFARRLIEHGYQVDCVIPSAFLAEKLTERLGDSSQVFPTIYEDMETAKQYDLILFSESFSYVKMRTALHKTVELLNDSGHLLICDFFRLPVTVKNPIPGGQKLKEFRQEIEHVALTLVNDIDITAETAPTFTILSEFLEQVARPVSAISARFLSSNYPRMMKLLLWKFRKRLRKLENRYFTGRLNAETYKKFKTYRLLLFKKN